MHNVLENDNGNNDNKSRFLSLQKTCKAFYKTETIKPVRYFGKCKILVSVRCNNFKLAVHSFVSSSFFINLILSKDQE